MTRLHPSLSGIGNVIGPSAFEDFLGGVSLLAILSMDGNQYISALELTLVLLCFVFGDSQAHQCSRHSAYRPPAAAPPRAARIGPAAMNGPPPGIAKLPIPTSHPRTPPATPPAATPVAAPSGALVCCSWAKSLVPSRSGRSTETSLLEKPALLS